MRQRSDAQVKHQHLDNGRPGIALAVLCIGMLFAVGVGMLQSNPGIFIPVGPHDGLRFRMLRLAQIAFIALPLLTLLYEGLTARASGDSRLARWGWNAMVCGMIGLPSILTVAALTHVEFKFLLPFPAVATFAGTLCGTCLARRLGRPLERWGWLLIAVSMAAGLLMGLYAFDGPLPPPAYVGAYNALVRRVIRLTHAYAIVVGFLCILISRAQAEIDDHARVRFWR
jgi:hypothetical protein